MLPPRDAKNTLSHWHMCYSLCEAHSSLEEFKSLAGQPGFGYLQGQLFSRHPVQTGFEAHPLSCKLDEGASFPGGKAAGV
jgi:hypothetical protein